MQRTLKALEFDKVLEYFARYCISDAAKAKALALVPYLTPYGNANNSLLVHLELFSQTKEWLSASQFSLASYPELDGILNYLDTSHPFLDTDGLWAIKETLHILKNIQNSIEEKAPHCANLANFIQERPFPNQIYEDLCRCIGDSAVIKDTASPQLLLIRNELRGHSQFCMRKVKEAIAEHNILHYMQDDFIALSSDRYVLPLKANFKGRLQGIIHHYSNTGETVFFEPLFLVEINNRIQELKQEEREEEQKILQMLTSLLVSDKKYLRDSWELLLDIDILQAKTCLANAYNGQCLVMQENASFNLAKAKHPLLALEAVTQKNLEIKPLDIHLREAEKVLVISGGNAGGKTVCLKTAGLIVLMTLTGLPVPVDAIATLPIIERIHAFIGDEQSLNEHVSTFTGQIRHLSNAWDALDSNSLVLLDEFGAGTDPTQGAALAQAVIDGILEKGSYALAATHFPALKTYALTNDKVRAASVLFNDKTKKPLFTLAYDQVGSSIALDVAREHGLPESIIHKAQKYLLLDGEDTAKVVDTLNKLAIEREEELEKLRKEQEKANAKAKSLQEKFEVERQKLHEEVRELSRELMRAFKEGKATAKQSMKEMAKLKANLSPANLDKPAELSEQEKKERLQTIKIGDLVLYIPWDKKVLVKEIDNKNNKIKIDLNGVSLWVQIQDVKYNSSEKNEKKSQVKTASSTKESVKPPEEMTRQRLDIRGKRADFALMELEAFLDKALLNSTDIVEVVHGKGTGALRKSVHDFLRTSPIISHYNTANENEGGDGMTLAYIK